MQTVLTIAGFDPSSGAGITADLMVFAAHGLFGTSCITSLTVQSTRGVRSIHPIATEILRVTLDTLSDDLLPAGIKIGMLATADNVSAVADFLSELRIVSPEIPVVLDPVLRSSSGKELLDREGVRILRTRLLPLVDWVTPNLEELAVLSGLPVTSPTQIIAASRALASFGLGLNILATCGHLDPPDDLLLVADAEPTWLPGQHVDSTSTHGTGCALSSAFLSSLVLGKPSHSAAVIAKQYVAKAIQTATPLGSGHGPLNHLWQFRR